MADHALTYADHLIVVIGGRLVLLAVDGPPFSLGGYADELRNLLGALSVPSYMGRRLHHSSTPQCCCTALLLCWSCLQGSSVGRWLKGIAAAHQIY